MAVKPAIAVIGAGLCGLHIARRLNACADVKVFEKSRGLGGRMSTRRANGYRFDHGAQYFTAQSREFQCFLAPFIQAGTVVQWQPRITSMGGAEPPASWAKPRYVASPGMNALCKAMGQDLNISVQQRIAEITRDAGGRWNLTDEAGQACGQFDWVVCTAPAEQSAKLMPMHFTGRQTLCNTRMQGCYSLMLGGLNLDRLTWDAAVVQSGPLAWIAVNHTKPGRPESTSLLCQSSNEWAEAHIEDDPGQVQKTLTEALADLTGLVPNEAEYASLHKWRFAKTEQNAGTACLFDPENRLVAAGDWCLGNRVEASFLSAEAAADKIENIIQCTTAA